MASADLLLKQPDHVHRNSQTANGYASSVPNGATNVLRQRKPNGLDKTAANTCSRSPVTQNDTCQATDSSSKSALALIEVRKKFLEYAEQNPDKVNERDKIKLATDDWYLKRYLLARNRKVKDTLDMLRKTMDWRNDFGIHMSEDAMFPLEFYKIGALFPYENDRKGNLVMYMRIKYHRKIDEMVEVEKHFLVHTFEKIDRVTNGQGLVIVFDCEGAGYVNCDVEFLQFLITCAVEHAPIGLQYIIVYKLPWVLNAFWGIAKKILPNYLAQRIRFCDEKSVRDFIDPANLPDYMNGTCRRNYRWIPPGCPSVFKLARAYGITDADIDRLLPQFQPLLDEAEESLNNNTYENPPDNVAKFVNNPQSAPMLLTDVALEHLGLVRPSSSRQSTFAPGDAAETLAQQAKHDNQNTIIRLFPTEFVEFNYDAFNDCFHATITLFNPSDKNSLAFKLMSNRPSNYSVKQARGVLTPNATVTISIVLLHEHRPTDKFLVLAQPLEGEIRSITKSQFDSLWASKITSNELDAQSAIATTHVNVKLNSFLRKINRAPEVQPTIKNPQLVELVSTCRSLRRRQTLSILINIILLIIIANLIYSN